MDKASPTCTCTLPPPCPIVTQEAEAPMPTVSTKHHAREAEGPPKHKHLVENLSTPLKQVKQDQLGRLVSLLSSHLASASSWRDFVNEHQGKSYLAPDINDIVHSMHDYLQKLHDHGV